MKKWRNKITGEINEFMVHKRIEDSEDGKPVYAPFDGRVDEWEDYEEPKESEYYWYIGYKNDIRRTKYHHISDFADNQVTVTRKEIGNCFESLEEAEKAVEKLKAWKRLKDNKFKFMGYERNMCDITIHAKLYDDGIIGMIDELNFLFGGEE